MKKSLSILLTVIFTLSLVACKTNTTTTTDTTKKKVVTMWRQTGTPEEDAYYKSFVDNFNKNNTNIDLQVTSFPGGSYSDQVNAAVLSGELPHVLNVDGPQMAGFVNSGALAPLDSFITADMKSDILPSIFDQGKYDDGKTYSLGQFESGLSFWANKSYLEKAAVRIPTLDKPWTKDEFLDALAKLQKVEGVKYALDVKVNYGEGYWVYSYLPFIASFGGDLINRTSYKSEGTVNGDATVASYQFLQDLVKKGYVNPTQTTDDDFYGTKISALSLVGHWMYGPHIKGLGDDAILIPFPDFGKGVFTGSGSWAWSLTTKAEKDGVSAESWKVIELLLEKDSIKELCKANGAVPARISALKELDDYKEGGKLYLYREQLEKGHALVRPVTPAFNVIQAELGKASLNILKGSDAKTELDKVAKEVDQTITDNGYHK